MKERTLNTEEMALDLWWQQQPRIRNVKKREAGTEGYQLEHNCKLCLVRVSVY